MRLDPDPAAPPFDPRLAALRSEVRGWVGTHVRPYVDAWEAAADFPRELYREAGSAGLLGFKYADPPDLLADVVVTEELARCGSGGVAAGLGAAKDLAPSYLARFGTDEQRELWLRPSVTGDAVAGLAVTEPGAGSDVAAITCRAIRDGDGWMLTGEKTFCTNGSRADWLLVAARTSPDGARGISLFVVPTDAPGFTATRIPTIGWRTSHTGALHLDRVRLPGSALLGEPGDGFGQIMRSFQWERLALALGAVVAATENLRVAPDARLLRRLAAVRALTYAALTAYLAGDEPLREVSAAKWLACDLDVATADARLRSAATADERRRADRALRDARLGPIGGGAREVMAELVARTLGLHQR